ncbi:putative basic proline-rich protein-like [Iris pallida]|uniref:Basic proline-rich protein-like n=1 Tax=Iris pallida TaxID=29817 RepID=A0AAX6G941_IRIPA|nr:putative basic proline-rich protein-like [Iris pallida]
MGSHGSRSAADAVVARRDASAGVEDGHRRRFRSWGLTATTTWRRGVGVGVGSGPEWPRRLGGWGDGELSTGARGDTGVVVLW